MDLYKNIRLEKTLYKAWRSVYQSSITSKSQEIVNEIKVYADDDFRNIKKIQRLLREKKYIFQEAKGVALKRKKKKPRPIVIASVQDRIVQRALLDVIQSQSLIKHLINNSFSFGGIKEQNVEKAIICVCKALKNKAQYYIKSDIKQFFSHIPKQEALNILNESLPDDSLRELLENATNIDLKNAKELHKNYPGIFPDYNSHVAQGSCLSPMLGNVLLYGFDRLLNSNGITCLRYIDDFIILAPSQNEAFKAFNKGVDVLKSFKLDVYHPEKNKDKASCGSTRKSIDFLGCSISKSFVHPDKASRNKFINNISSEIEKSKADFFSMKKTNGITIENSFTSTLYRINQSIRAWGNYYSFCNSDQIFDNLDNSINELIKNYINTYAAIRKNMDQKNIRRLLGVHLLNDCNKKSIYPLVPSIIDDSFFEVIE